MQPPDSASPPPPGQPAEGDGLSFAGLTEFMRPPPAPAAYEWLRAGTRLGDVTIVRLVAEGGMGLVYEGLQGLPCRTVAVKLVRPGLLSTPAAKRVEYEAQILGRLTHPAIARIYSVGLQRLQGCEVPYFVMEFVEDARPICGFATARGLSTRERLHLFLEACRGVAHGHHRGIVHRDLKPGNILVDATGQPKVIDFGVARAIDSDIAATTLHTDVGQLVGTLQYMAPEQFDGTSDHLDMRVDVYALGLVLYELLTGRLPYDVTGRSIYDFAHVVKEAEPRSLSAVDRRLRGDLSTIVAKCLEKDRARRYSHAAELEADLGRYLRGEPIHASPPRLVDSIVRVTRRHRVATATAATALVALVCGLFGVSIFAMRVNLARREAIRQALVAEAEREEAGRERARADAEASMARDRLYVANLRAIQSAIATRNLRMARQLYAENREMLAGDQPLEMRCVGPCLDEAIARIDPGRGAVTAVEYDLSGDLLGVVSNARAAASRTDSYLRLYQHPLLLHQGGVGRLTSYRRLDACRYEPAAEGGDGWLRSWRARLRFAGDPTARLATTADGRRAAVVGRDGSLRVLDGATGTPLVACGGSRGKPVQAAFNAVGSRLACRDAGGTLRLWDAETGRRIAGHGGAEARVEGFQFNRDGSCLAATVFVAGRMDRVLLIDGVDGGLVSTVTMPTPVAAVTTSTRPPSTRWQMAFSPDGRTLATTASGHDVWLWNVADGRQGGCLPGHSAVVETVAFSGDGRWIATGAANGQVRVWNAATAALEQDLVGHEQGVTALAFSPREAVLASGSQDGTARLWSIGTGPLAMLPGSRGMTAVAFHPDGRQLAVAPQGSGTVELWNPATCTRLRTLAGPGSPILQIAYSPDGRLLAASCAAPAGTHEVCVWRPENGDRVATLADRGSGMMCFSFSPDGARLASACINSKNLSVWNPLTGERLATTTVGPHGSRAVVTPVFGLDGTRIAYTMPQLVDPESGAVVANLPRLGQVTCLATSRCGKRLAIGTAIGRIHLADIATGKSAGTVFGHSESVTALAFSPDGRRFVSAARDGTARLWETHDTAERHAFVGHEGAIESVCFSPDGSRIVTGGADGTTRIWHADLGQEVGVLPGQRDFPRAFALSPDGTQLVAAESDGPIRIWGLSNAAVMDARRSAAGDAVPPTELRVAGPVP